MAKYNAEETEKKLTSFWENEKVYEFDLNDENIYSIDTPPPTVSGKIHIGHIFSYTQTEIIARYQRMLGKNVFYPFGFDDNGLPTERLVEEELGVKAIDLGREKFIKECFLISEKYRSNFRDLFKRMGFSVDWNYEYNTASKSTQKIAQLSFLKLLEEKKVVNKLSASLYCSECKTVVAQAEIEDKELNSVFYDLKFKLDNNQAVTVATTRPELLPACVAVLVNPNDNRYKDIIGQYILPPIGEKVKIIADDLVSIDKGTGIVMCCTYGDELDLEWVKKHNLSEKIIISEKGLLFGTGINELNGLHIKKARKVIVEYLKSKDLIIKEEPIIHTVKTHERCGTPMEIIPIAQWFIKILDNKNKFLEIGNNINWNPSSMQVRYTQWIENLKWDWAISRQRFFGVPIPLWKSKITGEYISPTKEELPVDPRISFPKILPKGHTEKDLICEVDVLDTWATSSLTPFINGKWETDKSIMNKIYPMDLRPQAHEIIRTWTFYSVVQSYYHLNMAPWKDTMISGHVLTGKNEKISKSKGNAKITPEELLKKYSADTIRYWTAGASLGKDIVFDEQEIVKGQKLVNKIWNASSFVIMNLNDFNPKNSLSFDKLVATDIWILKRLEEAISNMKNYLDKYEIGLARKSFEDFFWKEFCDNYLEIVKTRVYKPEKFTNGLEKQLSAQTTLYITLNAIIKMMSAYLPFVTEEIYQNYFRKFENIKSIHNTIFPNKKILPISTENYQNLEDGISLTLNVINKVRKFKSEHQLKLSTELDEIIIYENNTNISQLKYFQDDLLGVTKTNKIIYKLDETKKIVIIYNNSTFDI